jgi:hypothetical protein
MLAYRGDAHVAIGSLGAFLARGKDYHDAQNVQADA